MKIIILQKVNYYQYDINNKGLIETFINARIKMYDYMSKIFDIKNNLT
jgi:hypothetical protein